MMMDLGKRSMEHKINPTISSHDHDPLPSLKIQKMKKISTPLPYAVETAAGAGASCAIWLHLVEDMWCSSSRNGGTEDEGKLPDPGPRMHSGLGTQPPYLS